MIKHAGIIPLIGGEILASDEVYGTRPEYLMSYEGFAANEKHLLNHYENEVPYHVLDAEDNTFTGEQVDVVSSVCPCAGLSSYHNSAGEQNENNQWMDKSSRFVLESVRPKVLWGENAPALAGKVGKFMREKLYKIGQDHGYNFSIYLTRSLEHGGAQYRKRTFYFFWRKDEFNDKIPLFNYYQRERPTIAEVFAKAGESNFQQEPINPKIPTKDDKYYEFLLEKKGMTHQEFVDHIDQTVAVERYIQDVMGYTWDEVGEWMAEKGYERERAHCERKATKLREKGGGLMFRGTIIPKNYIGAFVVHYPHVLTHPVEDRYVTYREAMEIMGLPSNFELLEPQKSINHICQNVPYYTAKDMATEVKAVLEGERKFVNNKFIIQSNLQKKYEVHDPKDLNSLDSFLN